MLFKSVVELFKEKMMIVFEMLFELFELFKVLFKE